MSVDYSVYIGPAAIRTGPQYSGNPGDMLEEFVELGERVTPAEDMCSPMIEDGTVFVANVKFEHRLWISCPPECGRFELPDKLASEVAFREAFAEELELMRKHFRNVVVELGVYVWAS